MKSLVVIVGETASGKTSLAIELAQRFDGEVIAADSWTVYKGFDIGTAKPTMEERAGIPHHLLDVAEPNDGFSAGKFKLLAVQVLEDIQRRGKLPIVVGGTGLYVDSILYDYSFLPRPSADLREELNAMTLEQVIDYARYKQLDLDGIDIRNKRRVIRVIENNGQKPTKKILRANTCVLGMYRDRDDLRARLMARLEAMVAAGFADEVAGLAERYGWDVEPMQAPDYRAMARYVRGEQSLETTREQIVQNDLQLAKKQRTWFKRNSHIKWVDNSSQAVDIVTTFLNK